VLPFVEIVDITLSVAVMLLITGCAVAQALY